MRIENIYDADAVLPASKLPVEILRVGLPLSCSKHAMLATSMFAMAAGRQVRHVLFEIWVANLSSPFKQAVPQITHSRSLLGGGLTLFPARFPL